jgi:2'-5' RNA ligase
VRTVSLSAVLDTLLTQEKTAEISTSPRAFFVHVRLPDHVTDNLREVQKKVLPDTSQHAEIDHVTLVYTKKPLEDHPPDKVHAALSALRQVGEGAEPIHAKIQGWGYFDGAATGGKTNTALVALLDAPGLEHLHVDMSRALKTLGIPPSDSHVFTPHITFGYLGDKGRAPGELPAINASFTIDKAHVASRDHHEIPLTGTERSMGVKAFRGAKPLVQEHSPEYKMGEAAAREVWKDKIPGGLSDDKKPSDFPKGPLAKGVKVEMEHTSERPIATEIAMDHLSEDKAYYDKLEKCVEKKASLGEEAAAFSMDPNALRVQRHDAPGKGTTSPVVGMAPIQGRA